MSFLTFHKSDRRAILVVSTIATLMACGLLFVDLPELHFGERPSFHATVSDSSDRNSQRVYSSTSQGDYTLRNHVDVGTVISSTDADCLRHLYSEARDTVVHVSTKFCTLTLVDVNTADSALLCRIPGVGAKTASRIIKLRDRLGGYYSVNQLMGIYNFNPELLNWFCVSDTPVLRKLNINTATFREINAHPYISYDQTCAIMNYRRSYGPVTNSKVLFSTNIFTAEETERLTPYIDY